MSLLDERVRADLEKEFAELKHPVRLAVFSQAIADPGTEQVKRLVEEVAEIDSKLSCEPYNYVLDKDKVELLGIQRVPAIAVLGENSDPGIRFYGLPSGYEFGTVIDAIRQVSSGDSGLSEETREALGKIEKPIHLQLFSTPT